ncbi:DUF309 domain-containing protein [Filibacter tadaridae]|uniref:DUF309 domain-containing protein n=1 Tax=Filibacter tadaridae TaxID=2483811 RepID=A0A3P5XGP3_9BACL|nr:DUF309 domain-containing protein [Filibacter tadaridae]VDC29341.1 hypothetical protein FILTAD_02060 [Filibacter tadaridae]
MHPLHQPLFVKFIVYFNDNQDYFECHEVLEEYWKSLPDGDKTHPLTAYILLSTGMYHWRRGNIPGALRTLRNAEKKFHSISNLHSAFTEEIDFKRLLNNVQATIVSISSEGPFSSFLIAVTSQQLRQLVEIMEDSLPLLPEGSDAIIHKHMLRDREDILRLREEKKKGRQC